MRIITSYGFSECFSAGKWSKINLTDSYFIIAVLFVRSLQCLFDFVLAASNQRKTHLLARAHNLPLVHIQLVPRFMSACAHLMHSGNRVFFQVLSIKPARWCKYWWCTILPQIFADIWGQVSSGWVSVFLCLHMHFFSGALHVGWESLGSILFRILLTVCKNHPISYWVLGVLLQLESEGENKREIFQSYFQIQ